MSDAERARNLRRRHMHERQAVVFGVLLAFLALAFVTAAAIYSGKLEMPWASREFQSEPTPTPTRDVIPCPPAGALPVAADQITVNVYNGTEISGLARTTADALTERGFLVATTANALGSFDGTARIDFGYSGVAQAYTIAAQVDDAVLHLDTRPDATVDVVLGSAFLALKAPENVGLDPAVPLVGASGCTPLETLAPPAAPTTAPPAQG